MIAVTKSAIARGESVVFQAFSPEAANDTEFVYWTTLEDETLRSETFNCKNLWSISAFGNVVLYNAQRLGPASYLASTILQGVMEDMFAAVYVAALARHALAPLETATVITGRTVSLVQ